MHRDIGVGQIGQGRLVAVFLRFENQASFVGPLPGLEDAATDVEAQFERHVQPEELAALLRLES
jgi:hypothetical protein